jgi:hypothetical protein
LFQIWWPIQEPYSFEQLPTAVKEAALSQIDNTEITECVYFSTKYIWAYREKKDGSGVSKRKRYKKGDPDFITFCATKWRSLRIS